MAPKAESIKILIADHDEKFVELLRGRMASLEKFDFTFDSCSSGAEMLEKTYRQAYDLIFLDTELPGMDGLEVLARVGQTTLPLPIIMMTKQQNVRVAVEAMKRGVLDYIMKDDLKIVDMTRFLPRVLQGFRLRQENAELKHINQMKDDFLATISHELRTPLTSILGLCEVLLTGRMGPLQETQVNSLQKILAQSHNLVRLINQLLDIRSLTQKERPMHFHLVSFQTMVDQQIAKLQNQFTKKGLKLVLNLSKDPMWIDADEGNLGKVVEHIVSNACKFTAAGGSVTVETKKLDTGHVQFRVSDTGQGIPSEALPHVFQKFFHADQSLTRPYGGMGLGLAFCKEVVEAHGGRIWAESKGTGQGTLVSFIMPKPQEASAKHAFGASLEKKPIDKSIENKVVLWVDDNPSLLELVEYSFAGFSFPVKLRTVQSGQAAIDHCKKEKPDLIVLDIMMPGMDGLELIDRFHNPDLSIPDVPILVVTGYKDAAKAAMARGAKDICLKPFRIQDLLTKIESLLLQAKPAA